MAFGSGGFASRTLALSVALLAVLGAMAPIAFWLSGLAGLLSASAAVGVCWLAGVLALAASCGLRGPEMAVAGLLLGMLLRMGIPLVFFVVVYASRSALADLGMVFYLLVAYLAMLAVETRLMVSELSVPTDSRA